VSGAESKFVPCVKKYSHKVSLTGKILHAKKNKGHFEYLVKTLLKIFTIKSKKKKKRTLWHTQKDFFVRQMSMK
jgi:hypothetical protein